MHSKQNATIISQIENNSRKAYKNRRWEWQLFSIFFLGTLIFWGSFAYMSRGNTIFPRSYMLSFSYMDQITWGARRVRSLQCWATGLNRNMHVVEPFVTGSYLGMPPDESDSEMLRFGNIFDLNWWNTLGTDNQGFLPLVTWDEFLKSAPLPTVIVQIVYEKNDMCLEPLMAENECNLAEVRQHWLKTADQYNVSFQIVREVCINFHETDFLSGNEFNEMIFGSYLSFWKYKPILVVFNDYRGGRLSRKVEGERCN